MLPVESLRQGLRNGNGLNEGDEHVHPGDSTQKSPLQPQDEAEHDDYRETGPSARHCGDISPRSSFSQFG